MPEINVAEIHGKRIKAGRPLQMYVGSPGSDRVKTLPAGRPSPVIDSYIKQKGKTWYQVKPADGDVLYYIESKSDLNIVRPGAKDESGAGAGTLAAVNDWFSNTATKVGKQAGFLGDGFQKSVSGVGGDLWDIGKGLKTGLFAVGGILILIVIVQLLNR